MTTYQGIDAATGKPLEGNFPITPPSQLDHVMNAAQHAFLAFQHISHLRRAEFLLAIAHEIESLGDTLVQRAMAETGLAQERIRAERSRTVNQLRLYASLVKLGEWVEATIDTADPNRMPSPKPDLRKQLEPLGPVVVFGASNFPLAYSAAGGDTVSALAAGCSVIVKAHPAHPGTSQLVADAIQNAIQKTEMPDAVYQHLHGADFELGEVLVQHPLTRAVGFTGSLSGGKALFDLANKRPVPIPVFAEMGSINPVLLLSGALDSGAEKWGEAYAKSITLSCGQFCTNPGLIIGIESDGLQRFIKTLCEKIALQPPQYMLHTGISKAFHTGKAKLSEDGMVDWKYNKVEENERVGGPAIAVIDADQFIQNPAFQDELFGPYSLLVKCENADQMRNVLEKLHGQLTGTFIGNSEDQNAFQTHLMLLKSKVGRLIFNGVPTGVEVVGAMQHGGPFPSTTDARFTAVGPDAIKRFVRPVAYQNCPLELLPAALQNENPLGIYRKINGELTRKSI